MINSSGGEERVQKGARSIKMKGGERSDGEMEDDVPDRGGRELGAEARRRASGQWPVLSNSAACAHCPRMHRAELQPPAHSSAPSNPASQPVKQVDGPGAPQATPSSISHVSRTMELHHVDITSPSPPAPLRTRSCPLASYPEPKAKQLGQLTRDGAEVGILPRAQKRRYSGGAGTTRFLELRRLESCS